MLRYHSLAFSFGKISEHISEISFFDLRATRYEIHSLPDFLEVFISKTSSHWHYWISGNIFTYFFRAFQYTYRGCVNKIRKTCRDLYYQQIVNEEHEYKFSTYNLQEQCRKSHQRKVCRGMIQRPVSSTEDRSLSTKSTTSHDRIDPEDPRYGSDICLSKSKDQVTMGVKYDWNLSSTSCQKLNGHILISHSPPSTTDPGPIDPDRSTSTTDSNVWVSESSSTTRDPGIWEPESSTTSKSTEITRTGGKTVHNMYGE